MPEVVRMFSEDYSVATEEELLDFCNRVRDAGGAEILEALLPSRPGDSEHCLIANSLNFGCSIDAAPGSRYVESSTTGREIGAWAMHLPHNLTKVQRVAISEAVGNPLIEEIDEEDGYIFSTYVLLPEHIGNAAQAFDEGVRFTDFNKNYLDLK